MALLKNLIVNGASRFLGHAYFNDISISGTTSLASLSVSGDTDLDGHVSIGGYDNTSYKLSANSAIINDWVRTVGNNGWYNQTHGGGWYMKDNSYIRSYNKPVMMDHNLYFGSTSHYVDTKGNSTFLTIASPTATLSTINADNLTVSNNLRATHFDL